MDPEDRKKLDRLLKLAEENNEYIHKVRRTQKTDQMWKAIYWVVIIVFVLGGFYFVQPYINAVTGMFGKSGNSSVSQFGDVSRLQGIVSQLKGEDAPK